MNRIFLLCALTAALLGSECSDSNSRGSSGSSSNQDQAHNSSLALQEQGAVAPIPEPSGFLIFSLGLGVMCAVFAWQRRGSR